MNARVSTSVTTERPMKIEIVVDPSRPLPLASRVAPAAAKDTPVARLVPAHSIVSLAIGPLLIMAMCFCSRRTGGGPRRRRRGGKVQRAERPAKSVADLDAEMEVGHTNYSCIMVLIDSS